MKVSGTIVIHCSANKYDGCEFFKPSYDDPNICKYNTDSMECLNDNVWDYLKAEGGISVSLGKVRS